jgi:hypothetical protein
MADTAKRLYESHETALSTLYGDLENFARGQGDAFPGTPGTVLERSNAKGFRFYAHQYYEADGGKTEKYVAGPIGETAADAMARDLRDKIQAVAGAQKSIRLLAREGFKLADSKTYATVAVLGNHGLFRAGALLIGSHAYGVILNQLGVRAAQYSTRDVDIARNAALAFPAEPKPSFLEMLKDTGIEFAEVPSLDRKKPGTSFKEAGKSFFQIDLLVPATVGHVIDSVPVPELKAHATALPHLRFLLGESQEAVVLAREGCCLVRVPTPERFALHKLIVSRLRKRGDKAIKDVAQASVLLAAVAEIHPGALQDAAKSIPLSARKLFVQAAPMARLHLEGHPRAVEILDAIAAR